MTEGLFNVEACKRLLLADRQINEILQIVDGLELPDAWIAAGTVRNAIWNALSGKPTFDDDTDVDVVFFDPLISEQETKRIEANLQATYPEFDWQVKNQVYMHPHSPNTLPYGSSCEAIRKYPERCTAIGIRLWGGELELFAPYGLEDIAQFRVRPTPHFSDDTERLALYHCRIARKKWSEKWPQLRFE